VQIIPTCIGHTDVKAGEPSLRSFPVLAELLFPAHGWLRFAQPCLMLTKTIPWSIERPLGKGRQADHPHVYAHPCGRSMDGRFHLTLGLNRNQPSATSQAHRDVLDSTQPASIQTDKPAAELAPAFLRFMFATSRKSNSTRLWLQYSILGDSILRCPEGIEYSPHRAVPPRHQCPGFSR
jgi:hypothetical protein